MTMYNPNAWTDLPEAWDNQAQDWKPHRLDVLTQIITLLSETESILEMACCTGHYIRKLRELGYKGYYEGIDITPRFISRAKALSPREHFEVGDVMYPKQGTNDFDLVMLVGILMHIPRPKKAIEEACRIAHKYVIMSFYSSEPDTVHIGTAEFLETHFSETHIRRMIPPDFKCISYTRIESHRPFATCVLKKVNS